MNKQELLARGEALMRAFCALNELEVPRLDIVPKGDWEFPDACAYYRAPYIKLCVERCAAIGVAGMAWSFPGYSVDRTPFGVVAHELGHHVDRVRSGRTQGYRGTFSTQLRKSSGEERLTSYCPNDAEWFAEMFRLFVTNPNLLKIVRPKTYALIRELYTPAVTGTWEDVMADAPERTREACRKKVKKGEAGLSSQGLSSGR